MMDVQPERAIMKHTSSVKDGTDLEPPRSPAMVVVS